MAATATRPPLEDPLNEREIFVTDVAGVGEVFGNISIDLAALRRSEGKMRRILVARLILTPNAASALINSLQQLASRIKEEPAPVAKPN
jgi:hypothetical protein